MKRLWLLFICIGILNAGQYIDRKGRSYWVDEKPYLISCIDGYKWIQFIEKGGGAGRGDLYFPSGNPQQMFEKYGNTYNGYIVPVSCSENKGM